MTSKTHFVLGWLLVAATASGARADAARDAVPAEWLTPAEVADFRATPSAAETLSFLERIAAARPEVALTSFGETAAGRSLPLVILSRERAFTPEAARATGRPIVLVQSGIHAGEIDGKDATLMLLRDFVLGRRPELAEAGILLFVPIFNLDGHERVSPHNRPNQNGPVEGMGFRTTVTGHDLNRDFLKLDTVEARALIRLFNAWRPHLHVDNHVTNGVDHDWVLTWLVPEAPQIAEPVARWLARRFPRVLAATELAGHRTGPYVDLVDPRDPLRGFETRLAEPRYSSAYFALRHRPSILVETHAHKPFRQRVVANRDFLAALFAELATSGAELVGAVASAQLATVAAGERGAAPSRLTLTWEQAEPDRYELPIHDYRLETSPVTGREELRYGPGRVAPVEVPWWHGHRPGRQVERPRGYFVLPGWAEVERRLADHGLRFARIERPLELEVETLRVQNPELAPATFQGRVRIAAQVTRARERRTVPAGALWIPAAQPDFEVAAQLLEPEAPDSLLSWGLLSTVFELKEWIGEAALAAHAARSLEDPALAAEWHQALADPAFAADPRARWLWWFRRTPSWDETVGLLPVYRVLEAPAELPSASR